jgi:hypothetical protein
LLTSGDEIALGLRNVGVPAAERGVSKYLAQDFPLEQAEFLAEPYTKRGHHSPVAQRLFKNMPFKLIPHNLRHGPLNTIKPKGISRGDFYELHYGLDKEFDGAGLKKDETLGQRFPWKGEKLGLRRFDLPERLWHGTPPPFKAAAGGLLGLGYGLAGAAKNSPESQRKPTAPPKKAR